MGCKQATLKTFNNSFSLLLNSSLGAEQLSNSSSVSLTTHPTETMENPHSFASKILAVTSVCQWAATLFLEEDSETTKRRHQREIMAAIAPFINFVQEGSSPTHPFLLQPVLPMAKAVEILVLNTPA